VSVVIANADGGFVRANSAHRALWGVPPAMPASVADYDEFIGWWPATGKRIAAEEWAMARTLRQGEAVTNELVECQPFGSSECRFILNNSAPLWDEQGTIIGGVSIQMDITDQRKAEARLLASEALLRTATDSARAGMAVITEDRRFALCNKAYQEIMEIAEPDIVGMQLGDVLGEFYETDIRPWLDRAFAGERVGHELKKPGPTPDRYRFLTKTYDPAHDAEGRRIVLSVVTDVTENRKRERALRESEARLRAAVLASPFPIMLHAEDGEVLELSRNWTELTGYSRREIRTHFDWIRLAYPDAAEDMLRLTEAGFWHEGHIPVG